MSPRFLLVVTGLLSLACAGTVPTPPEPVPAPEPEPDPAPRPRPERDTDCLHELVGVLTNVPGFPTPDKAHPGPIAFFQRTRGEGREFATLRPNGELVRSDGEVGCKGAGEEACLNLVYDYEGNGLPVYEVDGDWVQVAVGRGGSILEPDARCKKRVWVEREDPMKVATVLDLLDHHELTHTLDGWDGLLYDGPDGAPRDSGFSGAIDFESRQRIRTGGRLWLEVELLEGHCDEPRSRGTGWIPATDDGGDLQVWYYTDC